MSKPLWITRMELDEHYKRQTAEMCKETGDPLPDEQRTIGRHTAVDARRLRGVPVVGIECGGVIFGTMPGRGRKFDEWSPSDRLAIVD